MCGLGTFDRDVQAHCHHSDRQLAAAVKRALSGPSVLTAILAALTDHNHIRSFLQLSWKPPNLAWEHMRSMSASEADGSSWGAVV